MHKVKVLMSTACALFHILGVASLLEGLPRHVLLDILALLPGGGTALPPGDVGAVLFVLIPGDGGGDAAADLVRDVVAHLARCVNILTHLLGDLVALSTGDGGALALRDLLGLDPGHQGADTPRLLLAVLDRDLLAGLAAQLLAVDLRHLDTPHLGDIGALLAGDVTAHLGVVNLLTDLAGHGLADLGVDCVAFPLMGSGALLAGNIPAFLLGNQGALPLVDNATLLGGNIFAHLILDGLALPLIDDLTLGLGPGGALLLRDGGALLVVPGVALLVKFSGAFLLMDSLLDRSGKVDALNLRNVVALLSELLATLLLDVIGSLAVLAILQTALLTGDRLLDWSLGDLALALLDISADGVGDIMALPPGDGVVDGLWNLLAHLLGNLAAHGLGSWPDHRRSKSLEGDVKKSQKKCGADESLHVERL